MKSVFFVILIVAVFQSGCAYAPAGIAPSTTPIDANEITVLGHASGEMSYFSLVGLIPFGKPDYNLAIADAIEKFDGGTAMINVRTRSEITWIVVGLIHRLVVEGDVVK